MICAYLQGPRQLQVFLASNAGPYQDNSLLGVPDEVDTGESFGSGEKVNVCKFQLGDVNNWIVSTQLADYIRDGLLCMTVIRCYMCSIRDALGALSCHCAS